VITWSQKVSVLPTRSVTTATRTVKPRIAASKSWSAKGNSPMNFVIQWLCYLVAFAVGSAVALVVAGIAIDRTTEEQALDDMPGSREIGAQ
jgi:uncharacterized membrane protein ArfB